MNPPKRLPLILSTVVTALLATSAIAAESQETVKILPDIDYGGDVTERRAMTGDWGGWRSDLSRRGIQFDTSVNYTTSSVLDGGVNGPIVSRAFAASDENEHHASWDSVLRLDTGKLGLWPGGLLTLRGEGRSGRGTNGSVGSISPSDSDMLFPLADLGDTVYDLTEAVYLQFLSERFGIMVGVLNTLDSDMLDLAGSSRGNAQFSNLSFQLNPVGLRAAPYKTFGGGLVAFPTGDPNKLAVSSLVFNTEDSSTKNPFTHDAGTSWATETSHRFRLFDRPGKQVLGIVYGHSDFADLEDPRVILPGPAGSSKDDTWAVYYSVEHFFSVRSEGADGIEGIGVFAKVGRSDGNPNPIAGGYALGLGGNAPWRGEDTFGIGVYYVDLSDAAIIDSLNVEDEMGFEVWYNFALTPWLHVTPDLQIIDQGIPGTDTATVFSLRTYVEL